MPLVQISKPRPGMLRLRAALRMLPGPRAAVWPLVAAWFIICTMLAFLPNWWLTNWRDTNLDHWFENAHTQAARLSQEWEHWSVSLPAFSTGEEAAVQDWLARESLVTAVVEPLRGQVWIREGTRLRPARNEEESRGPANWARRAMEATNLWTTSGAPGAEQRRGPASYGGVGWLVDPVNIHGSNRSTIVTFSDRWCVIKCWVPGSPQVEAWLRGTLRPGTPYRFGLISTGVQGYKRWKAPKSFSTFRTPAQQDAPGPFQATNPEDAPYRLDPALSISFGAVWECVLQMSPDSFRTFRKAYLLRQRLAWTSYGLVVAASGLAMALVLFARNRERTLADRLATLTHSLKTPLAVLKLRCDTALNIDLSRESQEARLLEIRGEVDQLVRTIENGLEEMRTRYTGRGLDRVDANFFERLDEDLTPAFEAQGRLLEVYGGDVVFRCCATVLRAALATLVENALMHGQGRVEVRAASQRGFITLTVSDEGSGIPMAWMKGLKEGNPRPAPGQLDHQGEGIGLMVLGRIVRQEGWGLAFSLEKERFSAILAIPT